MSRIWYAAYSEDFVIQAREIFRRLGKDVLVQVWDPLLVDRMVSEGVRVIMARGGTTTRIRRAVTLPVVDIPIPFEDMVHALVQASRYGPNIGVIGYNNLLNGLERLNPLLNVNISQIFAVDAEDTYRKILTLRERGMDVVVGGLLQTRYARELGMNSVRIDLSEKALLHACEEARQLLDSLMVSTKQAEELRAILNTTHEGYVAVDAAGAISLLNRTAERFLSPGDHAVGRPLPEIFPCFAPVMRVLRDGSEILQETSTLWETDILYDVTPLKDHGGEILGAIITFHDAGTITRGEHKIRDRVKKGFDAHYRFGDIAGHSAPMKECVRIARKYARTDSTVLILGETGVGKEMFTQSMHQESGRRAGPFVAINCAALPEGILESELFGYEEGAFTGARKNGKMGLFELAHNGTIFLDEIGEIPFSLQSRLLRVLQERRVMRLGGDRLFPVNVRVMAATNRDLIARVREGRFREDLFYRLNVLTLKIPPLRERREDIPVLARSFLPAGMQRTNHTFTEEAYRSLQEYDWPGNVRQLIHFMEKVLIISETPVITGAAIRQMIADYEPEIELSARPAQAGFPAVTRDEIIEVLRRSEGNRAKAAKLLQIHRSTLWRYLKRYGIDGGADGCTDE